MYEIINNIIYKLITIIFLLLVLTSVLDRDTTMDCIKKMNLDRLILNERNKIHQEIKSIEEADLEDNSRSFNPNNISNLSENFQISNNYKLYLFFTQSCPHSQAFLPNWYRVKNAVGSDVDINEYDCSISSNKSICSQYNISAVPTMILIVNGVNNKYNGSNNLNEIVNFLRTNGLYLSLNEDFVDFNTNELNEKMQKDAEMKCPEVSFDKKMDGMNNQYAFQIFDKNGLYGYSEGGTGSPLDSYHAAYNCFDTYLSTLPSDSLKETCAIKYRSQIRDFNLCNKEKLDEILSYPSKIIKGDAKPRMDDIDYSSNKSVVKAIKKACYIEDS